MKLLTTRNDLSATLSAVRNLVVRSTTIPIMSCLKLEASDGRLIVTATDAVITGVSATDATVSRGGAVAVSAQVLHDFVGKIPKDQPVELDAENGELHIRSGKRRAKIGTLPADSYPTPRDEDWRATFRLSKDALDRVLIMPSAAAAVEESRPYLCGVYLDHLDGELRGVATNGVALIRSSIEAPEIGGEIKGAIVPNKTLANLKALAGEIEVLISERAIRFCSDRVTITSRLIEGSYPHADSVIIRDWTTAAEFDRAELEAAIDLVSVMSEGKTSGVRLTIKHGSAIVESVADAGVVNAADQEIACDLEDQPAVIGIHAKHMLALLSVCEGERFRLCANGTGGAMRLFDVGNESAELVQIQLRV